MYVYVNMYVYMYVYGINLGFYAHAASALGGKFMQKCVHVYLRMYVFMYVFLCTYTQRARLGMSLCNSVYICMCICMYVYMYVFCMCICMYVYMYVFLYTCTYSNQFSILRTRIERAWG